MNEKAAPTQISGKLLINATIAPEHVTSSSLTPRFPISLGLSHALPEVCLLKSQREQPKCMDTHGHHGEWGVEYIGFPVIPLKFGDFCLVVVFPNQRIYWIHKFVMEANSSNVHFFQSARRVP